MEITTERVLLVMLAVAALLGFCLFQFSLLMNFFTGLVPFDFSRPSGMKSDAISVYSGEGNFQNPQFTADGRQIVYIATTRGEDQTEEWGMDIWIVDRDGTDRTRLTRLGDISQMWVSPATDRIAYSRYDAGNVSVFLTTAGGTPPVRIPGPEKFTYFSSWSPDGNRIAVTGLNPSDLTVYLRYPDGNVEPALGNVAWSRLYVMNADGSNPVPCGNVLMDLWSPSIHAGTGWSPDGTRIAFPYYDQGMTGLAIADLSSGRVARITGDGGTHPQWSPDGNRIAFIRDGNVYVIRPDGSAEVKISSDGTTDSLSWIPADTRLAYSTGENIWIVDPDGTDLTPLASVHPGQISWSPDGKTFAFAPGTFATGDGSRIGIMTLATAVSTASTIESSDLVLQPFDIPGNFVMVGRSERRASDITQLGRSWGWIKGYAVIFQHVESDALSETFLEHAISVYPIENINRILPSLHYHQKEDSDISILIEALPDPGIGDSSMATRITGTTGDYHACSIDFVKKDFYENIMMTGPATDCETVKKVAAIAAAKIT
jgi:Tol biopolymer transport system component